MSTSWVLLFEVFSEDKVFSNYFKFKIVLKIKLEYSEKLKPITMNSMVSIYPKVQVDTIEKHDD
jgi:hypothetical protein